MHNGRTDGGTDRRRDGGMDRPSYRDARMGTVCLCGNLERRLDRLMHQQAGKDPSERKIEQIQAMPGVF